MDKGLHNKHKTVGVYSSMEGDKRNLIITFNDATPTRKKLTSSKKKFKKKPFILLELQFKYYFTIWKRQITLYGGDLIQMNRRTLLSLPRCLT